MGVNVVENEETSEEGEEASEERGEEGESGGGDLVEVQQKVPAKAEAKEPTGRTEDPVRMYLREMGSVELLSREGEIAIAKRIEAGREAMIAGLCESPLTFQAIIIWREELNEGKVFLRDIIDLEATYAGPDAKAMPAPVIGPDGQPAAAAPPAGPGHPEQVAQRFALARAGAPLQEAQGRDHQRGEVAAAQSGAYRRAGRAALRHQQAPCRLRGPSDAARREPRGGTRGFSQELPGLRARSALAQPRCPAERKRLEKPRYQRQEQSQEAPP